MLALTDEALALIVIAAGTVPIRARGRWLRQLAARFEPPFVCTENGTDKTQSSNGSAAQRTRRISNGAARTRLYRMRQAAGRVTLHIEIDFNAASGALAAAGLLSEAEIDDAAAVTRAIERIVSLLPVRLNGDV